MSCAVGIPAREGRVELAVACAYHLVVGVAILTVYVRNLVRLNQSVVERRVVVLLVGIGARNVDAAKVRVPLVVRGACHLGEVPCRHFCLHISACALNARCRHSHFHEQLLTAWYVERSHESLSALCVHSLRQLNVAYHRSVELHHEEVVLVYPHLVAYVSGERLCVLPLCLARDALRVILLVAPSRSVLQVDEHGSRVGVVERVAVERNVRRRCQLGLYLSVGKIHRVVAWRSELLLFRIVRAVAVPCACAFSACWHHEDVAQIHTARAVEVGLCESPNERVAVYVLRAVAPAHSTRHRAGLYHAERAACAGESVSVVGVSDERVNVLCVVGGVCKRRSSYAWQQTERSKRQFANKSFGFVHIDGF